MSFNTKRFALVRFRADSVSCLAAMTFLVAASSTLAGCAADVGDAGREQDVEVAENEIDVAKLVAEPPVGFVYTDGEERVSGNWRVEDKGFVAIGIYAKYGDRIAFRLDGHAATSSPQFDVEVVTPNLKSTRVRRTSLPGLRAGELQFAAKDTGLHVLVVRERSGGRANFRLFTRLVENTDRRDPWSASYCDGKPISRDTIGEALAAGASGRAPAVGPTSGRDYWKMTVRVGGFRTITRSASCLSSATGELGQCGPMEADRYNAAGTNEENSGTVYGRLLPPFLDFLTGRMNDEAFALAAAHGIVTGGLDESYVQTLFGKRNPGEVLPNSSEPRRTVAADNPGRILRPVARTNEPSSSGDRYRWGWWQGSFRSLEGVISTQCYWSKATVVRYRTVDGSPSDLSYWHPAAAATVSEVVDYGTYDDVRELK